MHNKTKIEYTEAGQTLEGWLVHEPRLRGPAPGILLFPEFMGLGTYLDRYLNRLAGLGYVVLAADMFGKGVRPASPSEALLHSRPLRENRPAMRRRARVAWRCLLGLDLIRPDALAAIGFSFGGCAALELARSGANLKAAVSFYGYLDTPFPAAHGGLTAKLLVFHGQHDPVVPMVELEAFRQEMAAAGADSRIVLYADAGHGFCNREMDGTTHPWNRYSRLHDEHSWRTLKAFLADALAVDQRPLGGQPQQRRTGSDGGPQVGDQNPFEELVDPLGVPPAILVGLAKTELTVAEHAFEEPAVVDLDVPGSRTADLDLCCVEQLPTERFGIGLSCWHGAPRCLE